jgi:hypothetical protein
MKHSFKRFLDEAEVSASSAKPTATGHDAAQDAMKIAAQFLDTTPDHLEAIDKNTEAKVLDTGREMDKKFIKMAAGSWVIRLFKALNKMFARIEAPNGHGRTYRSVMVSERIEPMDKDPAEDSIGWWIVRETDDKGAWGPFKSLSKAQDELKSHKGYATYGVSDEKTVYIEYGWVDEDEVFHELERD